MTQICLKNIIVLDSGSDWHGKKATVLIKDGIVAEIGDTVAETKDTHIINGDGLCASPGWIDLRANFCDPGLEYKEDMASGLEAAAYGGFTGVALLPETEPLMANKASVEYALGKAKNSAVNLYPLASIASDPAQEELTEMFDVQQAGAKGFSSGYRPIKNSGFLIRAMEYAGMCGLPLMVRPENQGISAKGLVNEGAVSVRLGLKGIPAIAEEADIDTILHICGYTGQPIHFSSVSTQKGMQAIEAAHDQGLKVSADVSIQHLCYEESDLGMFDTALKLNPPLRTAKDRDYLRKAVLKNEFVCVASDHNPQDEDHKKCEFEIAAYGAIGLQTVFAQMVSVYGEDKIGQIASVLSQRPRKVLNLEPSTIQKGSKANLTVFDPKKSWTLNEATNRSKSKNSPLWGKTLKGKAVAIINKGQLKELK